MEEREKQQHRETKSLSAIKGSQYICTKIQIKKWKKKKKRNDGINLFSRKL